MTDLIANPEYESLCKEIQSLQSELSHALAELDQLQTKTRPYLLALYHEKLGQAELACLREQCKTEWLRRYMEHVQAARNKGMTPLVEHIEAALQQELENYWAELRDTASKIEAAHRFMGSLMKPAESREFRQLYLRLVKRLHPDINPGLGDRERLFWRRVQEAYSAGDIEELRSLWQSVAESVSAR